VGNAHIILKISKQKKYIGVKSESWTEKSENMPEIVDWKLLAQQVGALTKDASVTGWSEIGSSDLALPAIELLIGEENLRNAVDYYISCKPGSELARHILWRLHPRSAMQYCYELYKSDSVDIETKISAIELLRVVGDRHVLKWIPEFLSDRDPSIQSWGIGILDQLLFSRLIYPEDVIAFWLGFKLTVKDLLCWLLEEFFQFSVVSLIKLIQFDSDNSAHNCAQN
jgi:hypothetical protein